MLGAGLLDDQHLEYEVCHKNWIRAPSWSMYITQLYNFYY